MYDQYQGLQETQAEKYKREAYEKQQRLQDSMRFTQSQAKDFNTRQVPVTLVEQMTDPRAAQLQMMFASLDERGKKTLVAMAAAMVKLHKDENHE